MMWRVLVEVKTPPFVQVDLNYLNLLTEIYRCIREVDDWVSTYGDYPKSKNIIYKQSFL